MSVKPTASFAVLAAASHPAGFVKVLSKPGPLPFGDHSFLALSPQPMEDHGKEGCARGHVIKRILCSIDADIAWIRVRFPPSPGSEPLY